MAVIQSMSDRDGLIWFDKKMTPWREAQTHVLTHTLHYGLGVFEGVRAYEAEKGTAIFRLKEHTNRLFNSAHIVSMAMPFSKDEINQAQIDSVKENKLKSAYIRPMAFYGSEGMGISAKTLSTHVIVAAWSWGAYMGQEALEKGIAVKTSSFSRHHVNVTMCKAKANGNYMNSILAHQEAINDGYNEALLLDTQGFVSEGSGENIFLVNEKTISTPKTDHCLNGITRQSVIQIAKDFGFDVIERDISYDELIASDEVFFSGTAVEITPISKIDETIIGSGSIGPVTEKLQTAYADIVSGRNDQYRNWLSIVSE